WFSQSGDVFTPPYPDDWTWGRIRAISRDGSVFVGLGAVLVGIGGETFPFISQNRSFELISLPPNLIAMNPSDISADGRRVVGWATKVNASVQEGVLWDRTGGVRTIFDELAARGFELPIDVTEVAVAHF